MNHPWNMWLSSFLKKRYVAEKSSLFTSPFPSFMFPIIELVSIQHHRLILHSHSQGYTFLNISTHYYLKILTIVRWIKMDKMFSAIKILRCTKKILQSPCVHLSLSLKCLALLDVHQQDSFLNPKKKKNPHNFTLLFLPFQALRIFCLIHFQVKWTG